MTMWQRPSAVSLLAAHLRGELERGRWQGKMPGVIRLARELGAARKTVEAALCEMEKEGLLVAQGHGRGRVIATTDAQVKRPLRIAILVLEPASASLTEGYMVDLLRRLGEAGHHVFSAYHVFSASASWASVMPNERRMPRAIILLPSGFMWQPSLVSLF